MFLTHFSYPARETEKFSVSIKGFHLLNRKLLEVFICGASVLQLLRFFFTWRKRPVLQKRCVVINFLLNFIWFWIVHYFLLIFHYFNGPDSPFKDGKIYYSPTRQIIYSINNTFYLLISQIPVRHLHIVRKFLEIMESLKYFHTISFYKF